MNFNFPSTITVLQLGDEFSIVYEKLSSFNFSIFSKKALVSLALSYDIPQNTYPQNVNPISTYLAFYT